MRKAINVRREQGTRNEIFIDKLKLKDDLNSLVDVSVKALMLYSKAKKQKIKPGKRKYFSEKKQDITKKDQNYKCDKCGKKAKFFEFHHRDGNRSNNDLSNCQALCLDCHRETHSEKTRKTRKK